jgi:hypothetical protein
LSDRDALLQDFAGAEALFKRMRSAIRHVAKELQDEAGPVAPALPVRPTRLEIVNHTRFGEDKTFRKALAMMKALQ